MAEEVKKGLRGVGDKGKDGVERESGSLLSAYVVRKVQLATVDLDHHEKHQ
jgi:hypothetical protein